MWRRDFRCVARWALLLAGLGAAGCQEGVIRPDQALAREMQGQPYSDREWATVLREHVRYGLVDYETLRQHPEPLMCYCALIAVCGPTSRPDEFPGKSHATAYYVNAYNALVLRAVLTRPSDVPTVYDLSMPRLETEYQFALDGKVTTLAELERVMLKASEGDVRTLLATSRAAMGTPRLANDPLRPETLDRQLATAAADALDLAEILRIDHSTRSILVWQLIFERQADFIEYWKAERRVRTTYLWNVLSELASPQKHRLLQGAVGYSFRPIAFDRSLNRWERRADRPVVP